jgi:hypothetical protein
MTNRDWLEGMTVGDFLEAYGARHGYDLEQLCYDTEPYKQESGCILRNNDTIEDWLDEEKWCGDEC